MNESLFSSGTETEMEADLVGRLNKLRDVKSYREPMLEAVANSIQAIEQGSVTNGEITIRIIWQDEEVLPGIKPEKTLRRLQSIAVTDNGVGFTSENITSFKKLDSTFKERDFGCLGIGRLLWLKIFDEVEVRSVCYEDEKKVLRAFRFNVKDEVSQMVEGPAHHDDSRQTTVTLKNIRADFQNRQNIDLDDIAEVVMRHFLFHYVMGKMPKVQITDGEESRDPAQLFKAVSAVSSPHVESFKICGHDFDFVQQRLRLKATKKLSSGVYLCAGGRVVMKQKSGLDPRICDELGRDAEPPFIYIGLVKARYLDQHVSPERKTIVFPVKRDGGDDELPFEPVEARMFEKLNQLARDYLSDEFESLAKDSALRLSQFVDNVAPEFKGFVNHMSGNLFVQKTQSNRSVWEYVNQQFFEYERQIQPTIEKLIQADWANEDPETKIREIQERIEPIASRDLARFAAQRKYYLDLFHKAMKKGEDGKYHCEDAIHSLIFPMQKDSTGPEGMSQQNLWLIDERLAFSHFLASDKSFKGMPITGSQSLTRMDIVALRLYAVGDASHPGELSIIEFKRPGRNDYNDDRNPIDQVLDYVDELRSGRLKTTYGEDISNADNVPIFCYVIAQFTESLKKQCRNSSLTLNSVRDTYFGMVNDVYFEIRSLNSLLRKAKERNRALLVAAKLGTPPSY